MITRLLGSVLAFLCLPTLALGQVKTETEPNNSRAQAQEIRLGDTIHGTFQPPVEQDFFKLVVEGAGKREIQVDLTSVPGADLHLEIQDKTGAQLWIVNQPPKGGPPTSVSRFVVTEGVYYVRVQGRTPNPTDQYTLSVRLLGPWKENTETEPNDDFKLASELRLDVPMTGRVNRESDVDYYVLKIPDPGREILVVQMAGIPRNDWDIALYDEKRLALEQTVRGDPGSGEIVRMRVRPGTYYLKVSLMRQAKIGGEYTLSAGKPAKPPATPAEVQQALTKALRWLAAKQDKDGSWKGHDAGFTGLALMAFLGGKCVQQDYSANVKRAVAYLKSVYKPSAKFAEGSKEGPTQGGRFGVSGSTMYDHAIVTLALTEALVDTNDTSLEPMLQDALNLIIRAQNTEHKPETLKGPVKPGTRDYGGWRYNPDSIDSDLSLTGWQVLALKAAINAGFSVPDYVLPAAAGYVRSLRGKDGSFMYQAPGGQGNSSGRAGMGAFVLQLCDVPKDPAIPPAIRYMQDNPPRWNVEAPGDGYPFYYWYYGTRAMYMTGGDDWRIWEDWMCRFLVDHQNDDGSWNGAMREAALHPYRVAVGALMLEFCCGQVPIYLSPVKRVIPGTIAVAYEKGPAQQAGEAVEIIMDASNSMTGLVGKETKIAAARRVLSQTINGLPDTMHVGFRVYGHRFAIDDYDKACGDTELLAPIGPVNKAALVGLVNKIQTKGRTPLVLSVLDAIKDFAKFPNGNIILVTDGIESCKGDIKSIAPAIKKAGLDLQVNIVGFDIREAAGRQELQSIAQSTGGRYIDAKDAATLLSALQKTLTLEYVVLDVAGKEAAKGVVGGPAAKLNAGAYTVRVLVAPQPLEIKTTVKPGAAMTFTLKKVKGQWILE